MHNFLFPWHVARGEKCHAMERKETGERLLGKIISRKNSTALLLPTSGTKRRRNSCPFFTSISEVSLVSFSQSKFPSFQKIWVFTKVSNKRNSVFTVKSDILYLKSEMFFSTFQFSRNNSNLMKRWVRICRLKNMHCRFDNANKISFVLILGFNDIHNKSDGCLEGKSPQSQPLFCLCWTILPSFHHIALFPSFV